MIYDQYVSRVVFLDEGENFGSPLRGTTYPLKELEDYDRLETEKLHPRLVDLKPGFAFHAQVELDDGEHTDWQCEIRDYKDLYPI